MNCGQCRRAVNESQHGGIYLQIRFEFVAVAAVAGNGIFDGFVGFVVAAVFVVAGAFVVCLLAAFVALPEELEPFVSLEAEPELEFFVPLEAEPLPALLEV